jgi:hypothetical protein
MNVILGHTFKRTEGDIESPNIDSNDFALLRALCNEEYDSKTGDQNRRCSVKEEGKEEKNKN